MTPAERGTTVSRVRWLGAVLMLVFLLTPAIYTLSGYTNGGGGQGSPIVVLPLAAMIAAIHLRHARTATGAGRPARWPMTLAALAALVYLPMVWWGLNWAAAQTFMIASALFLLRLRWAVLIGAATELGTIIFTMAKPPAAAQLTSGYQGIYVAIFWLTWLTLGGVSLYGAARLVAVGQQLSAARQTLAEAAVAQERLRLSRDLHDLLGQSLSAVSLKGDLALALLRSNPVAAHTEVEGLTRVARTALHGMQAVTRNTYAVRLRDECRGAAALLAAAGIDVHLEITPETLPNQTEQLFGWAVREGVTNILRHSAARRASITVRGDATEYRLDITNDGARIPADAPPADAGSGLAGLSERATILGGSLTTRHVANQFRLVLDIPNGPSAASI